ncbi:MAG: hypothetical protein M3P85_04650 [Actinomycetota bacterium]|nr:hypothetical protein [Actinomycetota bacterium]
MRRDVVVVGQEGDGTSPRASWTSEGHRDSRRPDRAAVKVPTAAELVAAAATSPVH